MKIGALYVDEDAEDVPSGASPSVRLQSIVENAVQWAPRLSAVMSLSYSSPVPVLRIYIVRHGETNENRTGIIQGQMDTVLNQEGIVQAHLCAEALKNMDFDLAFSSDLKRTVQVCKELLHEKWYSNLNALLSRLQRSFCRAIPRRN